MKQLYYSTVMKIIIYSSFEMMADIVCTRLLLLFVSRKLKGIDTNFAEWSTLELGGLHVTELYVLAR